MNHDDFTLTRDLAASPARAFAAWADPDKKRRWFVDSDGPEWKQRAYTLDFRVGGRETGAFELTEGPGKGLHENATTYLDIVPDARIVMAYTMARDGVIHSASLATVTFQPSGSGTRLTYVEQMAFTDQSDGVSGRVHGWTHLLDAMAEATAPVD